MQYNFVVKKYIDLWSNKKWCIFLLFSSNNEKDNSKVRSIVLFTNKDHPSRLLLPTFIFGYLLSNYRFYDSLLTILYVYKYQEHHIQIIYSTISVLSICKYILMSIYHRNMFLTVGQVILIMCCISYQEMLTKIKVDPDFFRSREIKTFRKMSISFSKEKKLLTKSELCTLLNLCWHSCSACYLLCLYLEDSLLGFS